MKYLYLFYTKSLGNFLIGLVAIIVTVLFLAGPLPVKLAGIVTYAGYTFRNYLFGKAYFNRLLAGAGGDKTYLYHLLKHRRKNKKVLEELYKKSYD